ncbi:zinc-finger domain-containing protein [Alphaproteobacteria bacterium LSUCC0684]
MAAEIPSQIVDETGISGDIVRVTTKRVACNGGGGALGHPQVWLNLGEDGAIMCPYCSREFVIEGAAADGGHGGKG